MADDDLMGFFSEIKDIEVAPESLQSNGRSADIDITSKITAQTLVAEQPQQLTISRPKIISKGAEIHESKTEIQTVTQSHPVYTYDYSSFDTDESAEYVHPTSTHTDYGGNGDQQRTLGSYSSFSSSSSSSSLTQPIAPRQHKEYVRAAAGEIWKDETLNEWPDNDFRIFVGDLAKEVTSEMLGKHFSSYKSFARAKVIRTKHESKARGYGFVSFLDPMDCAKAIREQNGKYLASRPMKITKSSWKDRDIKEVKKKETKKRKVQESLGLS